MSSESETSPPRLSFSHDFISQETEPVEAGQRSCHLCSNSDFEFSFISENEQRSSSADDLFSNGVIVPVEYMNQIQISELPSFKKSPFSENPTAIAESSELEQKQRSKSFWGFKRSSSLHCEIESSLISSIPLLSRSNSTGSNPNKKPTNSKSTAAEKSSSPPLFYASSSKSFGQRKIRKGFNGSYPWINPVLNLPTPYISRGSSTLFGFGSCLRHGRGKQIKN